MISEFSSMWMTPEEEAQFNRQWEAIYNYARRIDAAVGAGGSRRLKDSHMVINWQENADRFPRLPKFRVRTDVEGISGKKPPRTGVYLAQDDPNATLQFAWTGNDDGVLGNAIVFNDVGQRLLAAVGRDDLWIDDTQLIPVAIQEMEQNTKPDTGMTELAEVRAHPTLAATAVPLSGSGTTCSKAATAAAVLAGPHSRTLDGQHTQSHIQQWVVDDAPGQALHRPHPRPVHPPLGARPRQKGIGDPRWRGGPC